MAPSVRQKREKNLEPSSGGIGIRLKTPRIRLRNTTMLAIFIKAGDAIPKSSENLIKIPKIAAIKKFESARRKRPTPSPFLIP